jgi:16S rRNA (adenine1518-N6/adenine1519-N6)-dimethyltransferase
MSARHQPRKRFGQNFLHDQGTIDRIIRTIGAGGDDHIVEIGPGQGALTRQLASSDCQLTVIELDRDLVAELQNEPALARARIIAADALTVDLSSLAVNQQLRVVGNLPYNISTPLIFHALSHSACIKDMHFMLQKEVVERMAATPGGRVYGRLSIMLQYRCQVESLFVVKPGAFFPAPKVNSALVRLSPYETIKVAASDESMLDRVVRAAFSQRRKTIANSLKGLISSSQMESISMDPGLRAERLSVADFVAISNRITESFP